MVTTIHSREHEISITRSTTSLEIQYKLLGNRQFLKYKLNIKTSVFSYNSAFDADKIVVNMIFIIEDIT